MSQMATPLKLPGKYKSAKMAKASKSGELHLVAKNKDGQVIDERKIFRDEEAGKVELDKKAIEEEKKA